VCSSLVIATHHSIFVFKKAGLVYTFHGKVFKSRAASNTPAFLFFCLSGSMNRAPRKAGGVHEVRMVYGEELREVSNAQRALGKSARGD
jgi:hypothetical protein